MDVVQSRGSNQGGDGKARGVGVGDVQSSGQVAQLHTGSRVVLPVARGVARIVSVHGKGPGVSRPIASIDAVLNGGSGGVNRFRDGILEGTASWNHADVDESRVGAGGVLRGASLPRGHPVEGRAVGQRDGRGVGNPVVGPVCVVGYLQRRRGVRHEAAAVRAKGLRGHGDRVRKYVGCRRRRAALGAAVGVDGVSVVGRRQQQVIVLNGPYIGVGLRNLPADGAIHLNLGVGHRKNNRRDGAVVHGPRSVVDLVVNHARLRNVSVQHRSVPPHDSVCCLGYGAGRSGNVKKPVAAHGGNLVEFRPDDSEGREVGIYRLSPSHGGGKQPKRQRNHQGESLGQILNHSSHFRASLVFLRHRIAVSATWYVG